jgi:hypothetical protein
MGAEVFHLYAVKKGDHEWYERMLSQQSDATVPDLPCTAKATIYTGAIAAGHLGHAVKEVSLGNDLPHAMIHDINGRRITVP